MIDEDGPSSSPAPETEAELIERIYAIALEPNSYDDFMEKWESYFNEAFDSLTALKRASEPAEGPQVEALSRHFEMGFRLLEELGRSAPPARFSDATPGNGAASLLLDRAGKVVWYNGAAARALGLGRASTAADLPLVARSRAGLDGLIAGLAANAPGGDARAVLRLEAGGKALFMLGEVIRDKGDAPLVQLSQVVSGWQEGVGQMLAEAFALTGAEVEIAAALAGGGTVAEIAARRESAVVTVRTQLKKLMAKVGVGSQTELVRLLVSLAGAQRARAERGQAGEGLAAGFVQRAGRLVPYHRFGPDRGRPVIFFHGMLDGFGLTAATVDLLHRHDIALIAPERPLFGAAAADEGPVRTAPERFARDAEDLADHLGAASVGLFGHMAGVVYAFAAAARLGRRARGLVAVAGGVPILSSDQFATMTPRQRLVAYTARYTPKLLPFILRAGIRELDFGGEDNFMRALYKEAPRDLAVLADPEIAALLRAGYRFSVAQGHRAFEIDAWQVVRDWTPLAAASALPVVMIHGAHDPVVTPASVADFTARLGPRARMVTDPDNGQLLFYANPAPVVAELAAMWDGAGG